MMLHATAQRNAQCMANDVKSVSNARRSSKLEVRETRVRVRQSMATLATEVVVFAGLLRVRV